MSKNEQIELQIQDKISILLKKYYDELKNLDIRYEIKIERDEIESVKQYNSEIEITFYENDEFFDIIEFFVLRNGVQIIEMDSLLNELEMDICGIINSKR